MTNRRTLSWVTLLAVIFCTAGLVAQQCSGPGCTGPGCTGPGCGLENPSPTIFRPIMAPAMPLFFPAAGPRATPGVTFFEGATVLAGPVTVNSVGQAVATVASLPAGVHAIYASYTDGAGQITKSNTVSLPVSGTGGVTVALAISPSPATVGKPVTMTVDVIGGTIPPPPAPSSIAKLVIVTDGAVSNPPWSSAAVTAFLQSKAISTTAYDVSLVADRNYVDQDGLRWIALSARQVGNAYPFMFLADAASTPIWQGKPPADAAGFLALLQQQVK